MEPFMLFRDAMDEVRDRRRAHGDRPPPGRGDMGRMTAKQIRLVLDVVSGPRMLPAGPSQAHTDAFSRVVLGNWLGMERVRVMVRWYHDEVRHAIHHNPAHAESRRRWMDEILRLARENSRDSEEGERMDGLLSANHPEISDLHRMQWKCAAAIESMIDRMFDRKAHHTHTKMLDMLVKWEEDVDGERDRDADMRSYISNSMDVRAEERADAMVKIAYTLHPQWIDVVQWARAYECVMSRGTFVDNLVKTYPWLFDKMEYSKRTEMAQLLEADDDIMTNTIMCMMQRGPMMSWPCEADMQLMVALLGTCKSDRSKRRVLSNTANYAASVPDEGVCHALFNEFVPLILKAFDGDRSRLRVLDTLRANWGEMQLSACVLDCFTAGDTRQMVTLILEEHNGCVQARLHRRTLERRQGGAHRMSVMQDTKLPCKPDGQLANPGDESIKCIVCMENARRVYYDPCGHVVVCMSCDRKLHTRHCPLCKREIEFISPCFL